MTTTTTPPDLSAIGDAFEALSSRPTCAACRFAVVPPDEHASAKNPKSYHCRRNPPQLTGFLLMRPRDPTKPAGPLNPVIQQTMTHVDWPRVTPDEWCGEFARRAT